MQYNNKRKDVLYPLVLAAVLAIGVVVGLSIKKDPIRSGLTVYPRTNKLSSIIDYVETQYVDTISTDMLIESTIPTMLKNLDPHSVYISSSDLQEVNEPLDGGFDGIGISFNMPSDTIVVISTIPGGPSAQVGLLPGDRIVSINDSVVA